MPLEVQQMLITFVTACAALWCTEHPMAPQWRGPSFGRYLTEYVAMTACTESDWRDCGTMLGP